MIDFIVVGIILIILTGAIAYIVRAKKKGAKCIGCPVAGTCSKHKGKDTGCSCSAPQNKG